MSGERAFTNNQIKEMGFPDREYAYPEAPGKAMAKLVMKRWGRRNALICYFDADDGRKLCLCVWFSDKPTRCYRPKDGKIDMSYVEIGSRMYIEYDLNPAGHARFQKAELID